MNNEGLVLKSADTAARSETASLATRVRGDFPALGQLVYGRPLVYLDSGASALKPRVVVEAMSNFYLREYANIHRGAHRLSAMATEAYEAARERVRKFIGAESEREVVFVKGCTEAINLLASAATETLLRSGDEVLITQMEHHSNILPWQAACKRAGARLVVAPITDGGDLDLAEMARLISNRTRIVAVTHISNVLGTVNPLRDIADLAHRVGAWLVVDGAQGVVHAPVDVQRLGCDFYAFSGHKLYGPTGIGVLWGRYDLLQRLPPYQLGGGMVDRVTFEESRYLPPPLRFEAGTPPIVEAIGLARAIDYVSALGRPAIAAHESHVMSYGLAALRKIFGIQVLGQPRERAGVISFIAEGIHSLDLATLLDQQGIAIRVGHHCAQPLVRRLGHSSVARASLGIYNDLGDIDSLVRGLGTAIELCR